jgi:cyclomaltodextrinase
VVLNNQNRGAVVAIPLTGTGLRGTAFRDVLAPGAPTVTARGARLVVRLAPWQGRILVAAPPRPIAWIATDAHGREALVWTPVPGTRVYRITVTAGGRRFVTRTAGTRLALTPWLRAVPLMAVVAGGRHDQVTSEAVTIPAAPVRPPQVRVSLADGFAQLSWAPVPDATDYLVYVSTPDGSYREVGQLTGDGWRGHVPYRGATWRVAAENVDDYAVSAPVS